MEQLARITEMEERLNRASAALKRLEEALDGLPALREDAEALAAYYGSPLWRADFEADEAGRLPPDLPRGVLSEDAVYDFLTQYGNIMIQLKDAGAP